MSIGDGPVTPTPQGGDVNDMMLPVRILLARLVCLALIPYVYARAFWWHAPDILWELKVWWWNATQDARPRAAILRDAARAPKEAP